MNDKRFGLVTRIAFWTLMIIGGAADAAFAQGVCGSPIPPTLAVAVGRSLPYFDLVPGVVDGPPGTSLTVGSGTQVTGRGELPIGGPLRLTIEAGATRWEVVQRHYSSDTATTSTNRLADGISAHHFLALVGLRTGRAPACAHVSAGGGVHKIDFRGISVWRPGAVLAAGMEFPTGGVGAIQVDAGLHLIAGGDGRLIASSTALALNLTAGWAYRF